MNVERLHAIMLALRADLEETGLVKALRALSTHLNNLAQQPGVPDYQQQVANGLHDVLVAAEASEVNDWPASWQETLTELGLRDRQGDVLAGRVESIVAANEITAQNAANEIQTLAEELQADRALIDQLIEGFERLNLGAEELEPGEAEVMVSIPRGAVHENLVDLGSEFRQLHSILGPFVEIVTGSREPLRVRAIASSDYGVYLETAVQVGAFVAVAVERIITAYKTILEIRLARQQLADAGVPTESLDAVDQHAQQRMSEEIRAYVDEVVAERLAPTPGGRENELAMDLRRSLNAIANRVDVGYNFDVRAGAEPEADDDEEPADDAGAQARQQIIGVSDTLKYVNRSGGGILHLPEGPSPTGAVEPA